MNIVTIDDNKIDEESSNVPRPQGNISPIHATTPDTLGDEQIKTLEAEE